MSNAQLLTNILIILDVITSIKINSLRELSKITKLLKRSTESMLKSSQEIYKLSNTTLSFKVIMVLRNHLNPQ